jgi:hypothetical protein
MAPTNLIPCLQHSGADIVEVAPVYDHGMFDSWLFVTGTETFFYSRNHRHGSS